MLLIQCAQLICLQGKKARDEIFADALSDETKNADSFEKKKTMKTKERF